MDVTVQIPDDLADRLRAAGGGDLSRRALEALALEEFKSILYAEADFVHLVLGALGLLAVTTALFYLARRRIAGAFLQAGS